MSTSLQQQREYYDHEIEHPEFEIERPRMGGRFYTFLMRYKVGTALRLLGRGVRGASVVDLCAGSGMDAELLYHAGARVTCVDISEGALRRAGVRAARHGLRFDLVVADAEHLPFRTAAFDFAFVHDGLHHLEDPERSVGEMARVSRTGLMITEPADAAITNTLIRLGVMPAFEDAGNLVLRMSPERLRPILARAGLSEVRFQRYMLKYPHRPGPLFRLLGAPVLYDLARLGHYALGVGLLGRWGNKLALAAVRTARGPDAGPGAPAP